MSDPVSTPSEPSVTGGVFKLICNDGKTDRMIDIIRTKSQVERDFYELGVKLGRTEEYTQSILDALFAQAGDSDTDSTDSIDSIDSTDDES